LKLHAVNLLPPAIIFFDDLKPLELQIFKLFVLTGKVIIPQTSTLEAHAVAHLPSLPMEIF
jgi:hypothetical protein